MFNRSVVGLIAFGALAVTACLPAGRLNAVDISLDALTPLKVGYIDLQKVFDVYPEKTFAEGDMLREIQKRKETLAKRQSDINTLRQQLAADQVALDDARAGRPVLVPHNALVPEPIPGGPSATPAKAPVISSGVAVQPYPTEEPLNAINNSTAAAASVSAAQQAPSVNADPLETLAASSAPVVLDGEMMGLLDRRVKDNRRALDQAVLSFRDYRGKALEDMKILQKEKTYDVMSKIYAVLETLARDEGITIVLDKSYVLYGEDSVDLSDKLIQRLQQQTP